MRTVLSLLAVSTLAVSASARRALRLVADDDPQMAYQLSLSSPVVMVGQPVTVSWTGACSHDDYTGCYDWVAPFQVGACNGSDATPTDTCYAENDWGWVSSNGGAAQGSWNATFDGPGVYEFRIPYCGCEECNILSSDFAECPSYTSYGVSPPLTVQAPIDVSNFTDLEQVAIGFLWFELEQAVDAIEQMMNTQPSDPSCGASCFCYARELVNDIEAAYGNFQALFNGFSMSGLQTCVSGLGSCVTDLKDTFDNCNLDSIAGSDLSEEILGAVAGLATGLGEVADAVAMVIQGESIYSDVSNAILSWELNNPFATGVNVARLINIVLSATEAHAAKALAATDVLALVSARADFRVPETGLRINASFFAAQAALADTRTQGLLRHPGGEWTVCALGSASLCRQW